MAKLDRNDYKRRIGHMGTIVTDIPNAVPIRIFLAGIRMEGAVILLNKKP